MPVPRAQLKVFSPLEAFPPRERERWRSYVAEGRGLRRHEVAALEAGEVLTRLVRGRAMACPEAAIVRRAGRRTLVCPLDLELRAARALADFRGAVPAAAFDAFAPSPAAFAQLERVSASGRTPHVLDEAFTVPLHWFVAFDPADRHFTDPAEGAGPRLVYLTSVARAEDRVQRAIDVVETTVVDADDVLTDLAELIVWLDAFDGSSLLELDYGGVAGCVPREILRDDHTARDIGSAIDALAAGDLFGAASAYGVARARWTGYRARQHAS